MLGGRAAVGRAVFAQRNGENLFCCCFSDMWSGTDFKYIMLEFAFRSLGRWERSRGACRKVKGVWWDPGSPVGSETQEFGRGSSLPLQKEEGLSDALLSCGPGLDSLVLENHPHPLLLLQMFFLEGASLLRASINPFLILFGPCRVILAHVFSCHFFL